MHILITGMEGFAGSHLAELALRQGAQVHGIVYPAASRRNLAHLKGVNLHPADITHERSVQRVFISVRPARVFHLAGQSNPSLSVRDPESTLRINVLGTLHVLEASLRLGPSTRVLIVGSADEYGRLSPSEKKISETHPLDPKSPYAISKYCQDMLGLIYFQDHGLHVVRVRPFNHIGPRQALDFVATDFASQIAAIEQGRRRPLMHVGNLDVVRDFSDVRDIVAGYWRLLERGRAGDVYNLGAGRGIRVRDLLNVFLSQTSMKILIQSHHAKKRQENPFKVADIRRIRRQTGWHPHLPLTQTVADILAEWRTRQP